MQKEAKKGEPVPNRDAEKELLQLIEADGNEEIQEVNIDVIIILDEEEDQCKQGGTEKKNDEIKELICSKETKEKTTPMEVDKKELNEPSGSCSKEISESVGKQKRKKKEKPKKKVIRRTTIWEESHMHLELKGEKGRLKPCEEKMSRGIIHIIKEGEVIIGSGEECDIRFPDIRGMGHKHCKINFGTSGKAFLRPLYARGLTFVNGECIRSRRTLKQDDTITFVKISFKFCYPESSQLHHYKPQIQENQSKEKASEKIPVIRKIPPKQFAQKNIPVNTEADEIMLRHFESNYTEVGPLNRAHFDYKKTPAEALGPYSHADALKRLPHLEIIEIPPAQSSQSRGEASQQVKKIQICIKGSSGQLSARVKSDIVNVIIRLHQLYDSIEIHENKVDEDIADDIEFLADIYYQILVSWKYYTKNITALRRLYDLHNCITKLHRTCDIYKKNSPKRVRTVKQAQEIVAFREAHICLKRMYKKYLGEPEGFEREGNQEVQRRYVKNI